jgi:hypothetical protein
MAGELSWRAFLQWGGLAAGALVADPARAMGILTPLSADEDPDR